jgi:hypothetical protein
MYGMKKMKGMKGKYNYSDNAITRASVGMGHVAGRFMDKRTKRK